MSGSPLKSIVAMTLVSVILVGLGAGAGYLATGQSNAAKADDAGATAAVTFDKRTLQNLGIELGKATLSTFVEFREVQAVIQDAPLNFRPVAAPLPGIVQSVLAKPGAMVARGAVLARIVRDAIRRPELKLTGEIFAPVSEALHSGFAELRTAAGQLEIVEKEIARVKKINADTKSGGVPVVSRQTVIDLGYERERAARRVQNARAELEHHGLSKAEIDALVAGGHLPRGRDLWRRILTVHGLWTDEVQAVYATLPEATRNLPWTIATLGEMAAAGIVDAALVESLKNSESLRARFVDAAGLLLQGQTLARLNWLSTRSALDSEFDLRAPGAGPEDWDVLEVLVRPGQTVAAGQAVAVLHDSRSMWLRVEPVGDEVTLVMDALRNKTALRASPLLAGVGPELSDLSIFRLAARGAGEAKGGDVAFIRCANQRLDGSDSNSRSWQLRAGMRYVVQIPGIAIEKVFVFPKSGVGKEGVDRVVYKQDGDSFRSKAVRVLFEDDHHVVVKNDGALFPGNVVAMKGAFVLGIAMQANTGGGGAHAGHSH